MYYLSASYAPRIDPKFQNSLTGSTEVAIVVSLATCNGHGCLDPQDLLGPTLYKGGFNPQYPDHPTPLNVPQQNFTVTVPETFPSGQAVLSVVHLSLVGVSKRHFSRSSLFTDAQAGPQPLYEVKNVSVTIQ